MFLKNKIVKPIVCSKCHGQKLIPRRLDILSICDKCNGYGELDWIENVTKPRNKPGESFIYTVDLRNAQLLAAEIKKIVGKYHPNVQVNIEITDDLKNQYEIMRV